MTIEDESTNVSPSSNVHANRIFEPSTNGQHHGLELSLETTATTSPASPDGLEPDPLRTSSFTHSVPTPFPYHRIHPHCLNCIRPLRCIRKPAFAIVSSTTGPNGGPAVSANGLTTEEIFALILNVNFYQNGLLPLDVDGQLDHCPVVRCPNDVCPMLLHYCKLPEHFLLCHHQKIPCLNAAYGCPYTILRKDIATHLQHCPANVVHCSAEWNRWPLHTTEKSPQTRVYCPPQALDIRNLDVALALRDQRMLKQLWSASRQMKRIMRGCLSTHPAVPIKPYIGVRTHREFATTTTSDPNSSSEGIGQSAATPEIIHHDEERYIAYAHQLVDTAYHESLVEILKRTALVYRKAYDHQRALVTGPNGLQYQGRQKSNSVCQMTLGGQPMSATNTLASSAAASMAQSSSSINLPILSDSIVQSVLEVNGGSGGGHSDGSTEEQHPTGPPPPPPVPKCNALSLEVSIRSLATYQPKPRSMYTFRCGADYRVDEIAAHHRDIHSDIHGGLDGWIEHRCPLFQYGCSFVHRRWAPTTAGERKTLVYNEGLEAFACSSSFDEGDDGEDSTQMTELSATATTVSSKTSRKRGGSSSSSTSLDPDSTCSRRSSTATTTTCCSGSSGGPTSSSKKYCSTMSLLSATSSSLCSTPVSSSSSTPATSPCSGCCPGPGLLTVPMSIPPPQFGIISVQYSLNDFPFEILQHICNYLDGYTLNNLSFASQRLRLVVQSFLKKKGYVLLQWKRYETEKGKYRWKVAYKKWLFSTAIAPITDWTMDSDNVIAEHLRVCPFNDRVEHGPEPFQCIFLNADSTVMMKRQRP